MAYVRQRGNTWYLGVRDPAGIWHEKASRARTKTEAKRLADDLERKAERQGLGLEALPTDSTMTLGELCSWWLANRCPAASLTRERSRLTLHVIKSPIGALPLRAATTARIEEQLREIERATGAAPAYVNRIRGTLRTIFNKARKAGLWAGINPVIDTEPRKVPKQIYETLSADELPVVLRQVPADWQGFFAAAAYLGLRKGECAGLRKVDVDLERGLLTIRASYGRMTTKGGHANVVPIPEPLLPYVQEGLEAPGPYLFPTATGEMRDALTDPQNILRNALGRAGLVEGWEHSCRRCKARKTPHIERHKDSAERWCPVCTMKLWPKAIPRPLRFHDLRHSCATILFRAGVDSHRVQRILRHASVTTTTGTYAHLAVEDLREAVGHLRGSGAPRALEPAEATRGRAVSGTRPASSEIEGNDAVSQTHKPLIAQGVSWRALQELNLRPSGSKPVHRT